jgi:hypothetical protein
MTATIDEVAKTLGEFEALAQKTGEWDGADAVEFSADGITWLPVWVKTDEHEFPPFARATVRRKGVAAPTVMIVAWCESVPAADDWRALWERKPMKLFGSFALRSAIRHAFRDVVGDLRGPDENDTDGPTIGAPRMDAAPRNWGDEIDAAETVEQLDALWAAAKTARARTGGMEMAYKIRRDHLIEAEWEPAPGPSVDAQGPATPERIAELADQIANHRATPSVEPVDAPAKPGRAPQDFQPPANRAERRAAAKRKGRR